MRKVASFRLKFDSPTSGDVRAVFDDAVSKLEIWLRSKGSIDSSSTPSTLRLIDGRTAQYETESLAFDSQRLHACRITEPAADSVFTTLVELSHDSSVAELSCDLYAGGVPSKIAPIFFDAKCPKVLHDIVSSGAGWTAGGAPASVRALGCSGSTGGSQLCDLIWSQSRYLPLVVVSDHQGLILHPTLPDRLARDLCGVATVVTTDGAASWEVTRTRGHEWSCYNGAIRVYWPMSSKLEAPKRHPLWTAERLLHGVAETSAASDQIRAQLRRRIFSLSTFAQSDRSLGQSIRDRVRQHHLSQLRQDAEQGGDWQAFAEEYEQENKERGRTIDELRAENADLKTQLANLQASMQWQPSEATEVSPDEAVPPATVAEAVAQARQKHEGLLVFGSDVDVGVKGISPDAGPPDKILRYLDSLAEMTTQRSQGTLGNKPVAWLQSRNIIASGEGEVVRSSTSQMAARTWNDGSSRRVFTLHLKPVEATAPDRCVRIYFDFDENSDKTIIGWLGRHP